MGLVRLLSKFNFERCPKTVDVVTLDPAAQLAAPKEGLYVRGSRR